MHFEYFLPIHQVGAKWTVKNNVRKFHPQPIDNYCQ